jgi:ABC-type lipoprotein export system ATPase subunit
VDADVGRPSVLLADEPIGNLDPGSADTVIALFERLRQQGEMSIVLVTHDPFMAARADRQLLLEGGVIRAVAPTGRA